MDLNRVLAKLATVKREVAELERMISDMQVLSEASLRAYRLLEAITHEFSRGGRIEYGADWDALVKAAGYPHNGQTGGFFSHAGRSLQWRNEMNNTLRLEVTPQGRRNLEWYVEKLAKTGQKVEVVRRVGGVWTRVDLSSQHAA